MNDLDADSFMGGTLIPNNSLYALGASVLIGLLLSLSAPMAQATVMALPDAIEADGIPPVPQQIADRLWQYQHVRSARFVGWFGEGGILITTRFSQNSQLHVVREPAGVRTQLTFADDTIRFVAPAPNYAQGVIIGRDSNGSEDYKFYLYNPISSSVQLISDTAGRYTDPVWSPEGEYLAFANNSRNSRDSDIYIRNMQTGKSWPVLQRSGTWYPMSFDPGGQRLLVGRYISSTDIRLYLLTLDTEQIQRLDPDAYAAYQPIARFSPDGEGIWFLSDRQSEYVSLRYLDLKTRQEKIYSQHSSGDVTRFAVSRNGTRVAYVVSENGFDRLRLLNVSKNRLEVLPDSMAAAATRIYELEFNPTDEHLALSLGNPTIPSDVYTLSMRGKYRLTRWTYSELGPLSDRILPKPEVVFYPTFDSGKSGRRRLIPALLYRPKTEGPHPVIVWIHGGPASQALPVFNATLYYMLNELGVAVIRPNIRGSSGYGKTFLKLDNGFRREDALLDIGALLDWISSQYSLDYRRVGLMGGSYGGYILLAALIRYSERIKAGVALAPITDFISYLERTPDYMRDLRRQEYGDERDPQMRAFLARISPRRQVAQIRAPLMVVQGLNDPRISADQTKTLIDELRANGGVAWYLTAANEGHGYSRKDNYDFYQAVLMHFWNTYLLETTRRLPEEPSL
ncbi:MAG: S9 family peptidase [Gammaproteobacteria bacterium]